MHATQIQCDLWIKHNVQSNTINALKYLQLKNKQYRVKRKTVDHKQK